MREKLFDLRGVGHGLGRLDDRFGFDLQSGFFEEGGQFRLILGAILSETGFCHNNSFYNDG